MTLTPRSSLEKTVTYYAPAFLKGDYELWVFLGNEAGLPLGGARITDTMKLLGSGEYIALSACSLAEDTPTVTCKATSHFTEAKTVMTPSFVTFRGSSYGPIVPTTSVENTSVTLKPGDTKPISFTIPKPKTPGIYHATLTLTADNRSLSNTASLSYAVSGLSASIENLSADKSAYKKGENATLMLVWSSSAQDAENKLFLDLSLVNGNGRECAKPLSGVTLERGISSFEFPVTSDCTAPMALARISDEKGRLLAQKSSFLSDIKEVSAEVSASMTWVLIIVGLLILLALIVMVYEKIKKNETATLMKSLLFLMVAVAVLGMAPENTRAETIALDNAVFTVNVNYDHGSHTVSVSGIARAYGSLSFSGDRNGVFLYANGVDWPNIPPNTPSATLISGSSPDEGEYHSAVFDAPSGPGTYAIRFSAVLRVDGDNRVSTYRESIDISFTVPQPPPPTAAKLEVSPDIIHFGEVPVGETRTAVFTLSNPGSDNLSGSIASLSPVRSLAKLPFVREALAQLAPPFSWTSGQSFSLAPGGSTNKGVAFAPTEPVWYSRSAKFIPDGGDPIRRIVDGKGVGGSPDPCSSVSRPSAWLSVDPDYVDYGGEATLSWSSSNADSCTLDGSGVRTSGSRSTGSLTNSRSFSLSCSNSCYGGGSSARSSAYITVGAETPPADESYVSLWADDYSVTSGDGTTLRWDSRDVSNCSASGGWNGRKDTSGEEWTGSLSGDTTFRITCDDDRNGGTQTDSLVVRVVPPDDEPGSGLNMSFSANPDIVAQGQSSTLYWSSQDVRSCRASGGPWSGGKGANGDYSEGTGSLNSDTTYSLTCENDSGDSQTLSTTVTVDASRNPSLDFWSDDDSVPYDSGTTLRWNSQNTDSCSASGGWSGSKGTSGDQWTGDLITPTTYNLECSGSYGSVSGQVRVQVQPTFFLNNMGDIQATVVKGKPAKSSGATLTVDRRLSFSQPVTFSVSGINPPLPGAAFHFAPEILNSSEYTTGSLFTVTAPGNTEQRNYTITVQGTGDGITRLIEIIMGVTVIDPEFKEF